ncbi:sporulation YhaL family protein [Gottfriedia acidiceleris]|uniref:Sporulation YhaL family protein n=1 Tax=Gottfriedia acidiceleris TaxID=371036 RepID=A0ABY4JI42_9BACI|nr:sporulation YhaL family protein [Gottfriedia acidiceleris]UPM53501.1 sporulation YhaL family protein [Gottfriedia acidiceleris]
MPILPFWMYIVILGIFVSGFMVLYTSKQERDADEAYIEKEGEIYLQRIKEERERREQLLINSEISSN